MWEYYGRPCDAVSVNIQGILSFQDDPAYMAQAVKRRRGGIGPTRLEQARLFLTPALPEFSTDPRVASARNAAKRLTEHLDVTHALWLPSLVVALIVRCEWQSLVIPLAWPSSGLLFTRLNWPGDAWLAHMQRWKGQFVSTEALHTVVDVDDLHLVLALLRDMAPAALADAEGNSEGDDAADELRLRLNRAAAILHSTKMSLAPDKHAMEGARGGYQFKAETLMQATILGAGLKHRARLMDTCRHVIKLVVAPQVLEAVMQRLAHAPPPSGSLLARHQMSVDLAFILFWRERAIFQNQWMFMWADSSPQAGADWLLSSYDCIAFHRMRSCFEVAHQLLQSTAAADPVIRAVIDDDENTARRSQGLETLAALCAERASAQSHLREHVTLHRQIPVALGAGASSLEHKTRAVLHALWVEIGAKDAMFDAVSKVVSLTPDMGVEMYIADAEGGDWLQYMPHWMHGPRDDVEELGAPAQTSGEHPLPRAFIAPGLLHIINNLTLDVDEGLPSWDQWLQGLNAVCGLLGQTHNRQRFVWTCIQTTQHAGLSSLFQQNIQTPIGWRWGSVNAILKVLGPLKDALQLTWTQDRFCNHLWEDPDPATTARATRRLQQKGQESLNIRKLTETVHNAWWWAYASMLGNIHVITHRLAAWADGVRMSWLA